VASPPGPSSDLDKRGIYVPPGRKAKGWGFAMLAKNCAWLQSRYAPFASSHVIRGRSASRPHSGGPQRRDTMKPTHLAYVVTEAQGDRKAQWHQVGAVWPHRNGNGFDLMIPPGISVAGRMVITERKEDQD
jgi:hypothetical protein